MPYPNPVSIAAYNRKWTLDNFASLIAEGKVCLKIKASDPENIPNQKAFK